MTYLLDTSFWYALLNKGDKSHQQVMAFAQKINHPIVTATPVTTEVAYLVRRDLGHKALAAYIESLTDPDYRLLEPAKSDYRRAAGIIRKYSDAHIDFVDAVLVAISERLEITRVLTLDQRHFRLFRPSHCPAFEILP
ncbi:MAG: PIN domain-containing protein [Anaerolineae bacterium]|nr:PIN domain-containing protein [Anaerolineae bacterium]